MVSFEVLISVGSAGLPPLRRRCLLSRCNLADQGPVRASVLQPRQLQLPAAVRVPLEEPASLLHDRSRGTSTRILLFTADELLTVTFLQETEDRNAFVPPELCLMLPFGP